MTFPKNVSSYLSYDTCANILFIPTQISLMDKPLESQFIIPQLIQTQTLFRYAEQLITSFVSFIWWYDMNEDIFDTVFPLT